MKDPEHYKCPPSSLWSVGFLHSLTASLNDLEGLQSSALRVFSLWGTEAFSESHFLQSRGGYCGIGHLAWLSICVLHTL